MNETSLSKKVWELGLNGEPKVKWSILAKKSKYSAGSKMCDLCLSEKYFILQACTDRNNLNIKSEAISLCIHRNSKKTGEDKNVTKAAGRGCPVNPPTARPRNNSLDQRSSHPER